MITEHAILQVKAGQADAFTAAMREAEPLIAATPGFLGIAVLPCVETPDRFLLLVRWESVEAHEKGFRGSDRYLRWKALLHHFYEPFPSVGHYGPSILDRP
ncbi:MAG: antibiotic biosynthesis monooxygenase [Rhizobiales bacterium]|nr:antibiotic biosynthesis monooxygenase [Hyphomicrobiales bacterium]